MDKPIKIKEPLVDRLDAQCSKFSVDTRQSLANTILRKGLDYLEAFGYDALLAIPLPGSNDSQKSLSN